VNYLQVRCPECSGQISGVAHQKRQPSRVALQSSSPSAAPGSPYVLTGNAAGHLVASAEELNQQDEDQQPLPADDYDARLRTVRQIVARRGQRAFRTKLLDAYSGRCAVTGCGVPDVLEAAHLRPYRGPDSNTLGNGLLLRADIHTLLDLMLLAFEPDTRTVVLSRSLQGTQYEDLAGRRLAEPRRAAQRPTRETLAGMWQEFSAQERHGEAGSAD
jgi:putative restriction endonuclease